MTTLHQHPQTPDAPASETIQHLTLLAARQPDHAHLELRLRHVRSGGWSQRFVANTKLPAAAALAQERADSHDVYVGVLARQHAPDLYPDAHVGRRRGRRRDLVPYGSVLWVDLDTSTVPDPLAGFPLEPSLVVASGTPGHRHAYWHLDHPVDLDEIEACNRALAERLGGDAACADAARILRLAGTRNHKRCPATNVQLTAGPGPTVDVARLRHQLNLPEHPTKSSASSLEAVAVAARRPTADPTCRPAERTSVGRLEAMSPADYVTALTGQPVPAASRKICCPLHDDRTASLHVYETAEKGWFCFGCRRGGRVYDLAAAMTNRSLRGGAFRDLQRDLVALLVDYETPSSPQPRR